MPIALVGKRRFTCLMIHQYTGGDNCGMVDDGGANVSRERPLRAKIYKRCLPHVQARLRNGDNIVSFPLACDNLPRISSPKIA
jgi:hypothetical protein